MRQRVARRILSSAAHLILLSRQHEVGQQQPQKSKLSLLLHHNWTTLQLHVRYQRGGGRILILATISLEVVGTHMGDKHERGWWWVVGSEDDGQTECRPLSCRPNSGTVTILLSPTKQSNIPILLSFKIFCLIKLFSCESNSTITNVRQGRLQ